MICKSFISMLICWCWYYPCHVDIADENEQLYLELWCKPSQKDVENTDLRTSKSWLENVQQSLFSHKTLFFRSCLLSHCRLELLIWRYFLEESFVGRRLLIKQCPNQLQWIFYGLITSVESRLEIWNRISSDSRSGAPPLLDN